MKELSSQIFCRILLLIICSQSIFLDSSITARYSNQNASTDYTFQFKPARSYSTADVKIRFPVEYSLSSF